jgi:mannosyltransferase
MPRAVAIAEADPEPEAAPPRARGRYVLLILLILTAGLAARIANLPAESLDGDEVFTLRAATAPGWGGTFEMVREDLVHPPLHYLAVRASMMLAGASDLAVRLPSLLAGLLSIALICLIGREIEGLREPALLAGALLAVHDWHIFYSQQARPYALFCMLTYLLLLWALRLPKRPHCPWQLPAGFVLCVLLVHTHYAGAAFALALAAALLMKGNRRAPLALAAGTLSLAPWLLWLAPVYQSRQGLEANLGWIATPGVADVKLLWAQFIGVADFPGATTLSLVAGVGLVSVAIRKGGRHLVPLAALGVAVPLALTIAALPPFRAPLFGLRHVLPAAGLYLLLVAWGWMRAARPARGLAAAGAVALLVLAAWPAWSHRRESPVRFPLRDAAREITTGPMSALPVYSTHPYGISAVLRHYLPAGRTVADLKDGFGDMPPELLVFHRPSVRAEKDVLDTLREAGCTALRRRAYRSGAGFSNYPELVHLRRTLEPR